MTPCSFHITFRLLRHPSLRSGFLAMTGRGVLRNGWIASPAPFLAKRDTRGRPNGLIAMTTFLHTPDLKTVCQENRRVIAPRFSPFGYPQDRRHKLAAEGAKQSHRSMTILPPLFLLLNTFHFDLRFESFPPVCISTSQPFLSRSQTYPSGIP